MEPLREQIEQRKSLQAQLKELRAGMPKVRQPKLDFETSVIIGKGLEAMSQGVKNWELRDCFDQLEGYLYGKEYDRVCLVFGLRRTGKTTMLRQAIGRMTKRESEPYRLHQSPKERQHGNDEPGSQEIVRCWIPVCVYR